jgi:putative transcriptional regulator
MRKPAGRSDPCAEEGDQGWLRRRAFGDRLVEGPEEVLAWKRGEIALDVVKHDPLPPERIREIRKKVAKSAKAFEERFGIPAATLQGWEQGRRQPDIAARILPETIELHPEAAEKAARADWPIWGVDQCDGCVPQAPSPCSRYCIIILTGEIDR